MSRFSVIISTMIVFYVFSHQLTLGNNSNYLNFYIRFSMLSLIATAGMEIFIYSYSIETVKQTWEQINIRGKVSYLFYVFLINCLLLFLHFFNHFREISPIYILCLILYFWSNVGIIITDIVLIVGRKLSWLVCINVAYSIFFIAIHLLVLQINYSLEIIIIGLSILAFFKLLINIFIIKKIFKNTDSKIAPVIHPRRIRLFWISVFIFDIIQILFKFADKFLVSIIISAGITAVYINGTLEIPFISLISASVSNSALLFLNRSRITSKKIMMDTINYAVRFMGAITLAIFFYFFVFRTEFIRFFFSYKYMGSVPIFGISLFKLLSYIFSVSFILKLKQKGRILNIAAIIDISVSLSLLYPLYHLFGLNGIILSFVTGTISQVAYIIIKVAGIVRSNVLKVYPIKNLLYKAVILGVATYWVKYLVSGIRNDLIELLIGGIVMGIILLCLLYFEFYRNKTGALFDNNPEAP